MRMFAGPAVAAAVSAWLSLGSVAAVAASPSSSVSLKRDGSLVVAGRTLRCGSVRNVLDPHLPNLGLAGPGLLIMNPSLLRRHSETVRLFVYSHECGHHHVGGDEFAADCWAVKKGVREGWLDKNGLGQVCKSFGRAPETPTHPSGKARCSKLDQCFTSAVAARAKQLPAAVQQATQKPTKETAAPKLAREPTLVRNGTLYSAEGPADERGSARTQSER